MNKLFTYGTLRRNQKATHKLIGYKLFAFKGNFDFPYIVPEQGSTVMGNLVRVTDEALQAYDRYEGTDRGFFVRTQVAVENLTTGEVTSCFVYEAGKVLDDVDTPRPIVSGDWFSR